MSGNLIWAIIAFGIMIFGHELGHFLVAKRVGITVQAFALGFGPKLVGVTRGETLYAINLVPFGGYVKLAGEDLQERGGRRVEVEVTSVLDNRQNIGLIGYRPEAIRQHLGPVRATLWGLSTIAQTAGALLAALGALLVRPREGLGSVMGPIGAVQFL